MSFAAGSASLNPMPS